MFAFGNGGHLGQNLMAYSTSAAGYQPNCKIICKAGDGYCLSVRDGNVVLAPTNPLDEHQYWSKDMRFSTNVKDMAGNPGFAIVNKATGLAIMHSQGEGHPVVLGPYNPDFMDVSAMWTESGVVADGFRCIRMVNNTGLNFNALTGDDEEDHGGVHDGTTVVLSQWVKCDNQIWKILPWGDGVSVEPTVRIYCKAGDGFSATVRHGEVVLTPTNPRDERQHWFKDMRHCNMIKDEEGYPAFALVNKFTGEAIKHSLGEGHTVKLVPYNPNYQDDSVLWTESRDVGDGFRCVRMVNNINLNFEALHGDRNHGGVRDGTSLVLCKRCQGVGWLSCLCPSQQGDNQRWKILPW